MCAGRIASPASESATRETATSANPVASGSSIKIVPERKSEIVTIRRGP